ncbi:BrxA family protein [Rhizobium lentis]|uniref:BrxA family protein n=2 Tax=Rhizobium lentis TaxID=1138194 RepID=UPI001C832916|nr:BrxA family protein [Rhizobium lentis]MBX5048877.1 DUF1819 family protein [Rhizobium lentis]MBX5060208.1 DUF1819 family protein [Rhizobium lentis]
MEPMLYTTQLQAGLGLTTETKTLLELWSPGMSVSELNNVALHSGRFPTITARRLRNIIAECFAPRYLISSGEPARHLKLIVHSVNGTVLTQLMLVYTGRANPILRDFISDIYWSRYVGGYTEISNDDARAFVERAIDDGKTSKRWSESTIRRVSAYLTGCCADYGLLDRGVRSKRRILPVRISGVAAAYLAYDLHFAGVGDNALLTHADWRLFGLDRQDVLDELKKLSLTGVLILQAAGEVVRISWKKTSMEALCDVLSQG